MNGVYCLTFPNGKRYVGKGLAKNGKGIEKRWYSYKNKNIGLHKKGMGMMLRTALIKYGHVNVKFEVILLTDDDDRALRVEKQLVALWNLRNRNFGYNYLEGGLINYMKGKTFTLSPETREKMSRIRLGTKATEEAKRNMSLCHLGVWTKPRRIMTIKNRETGVVETGGVRELSRKCGISPQHISTRGVSKGWVVISADPKGKKFGNP